MAVAEVLMAAEAGDLTAEAADITNRRGVTFPGSW
jgi:hypothetical protein